MDFWNIHSKILDTLLLWRTEHNQFRVVQQGSPSTLLTNSDYILIDKRYQALLDRLSGQLTQKPVIIVDKVTQQTWDNFIEIEILNEIEYGQTDKLDCTGLRIWRYSDEYVFVSGDLKDEIEKLGKHDLKFTLGFSYFVAGETNK